VRFLKIKWKALFFRQRRMGLSISKSVSALFAPLAASGAHIYLRQISLGKN
jgi:hypothetical protein